MKQYEEMKKKHPDAILLFRVGDFYETFSNDAVVASDILGITFTRRANGKAKAVELAGFPYHALDTYLPKLVRAGKRVAICEQLEDPKLAKNSVKRGVTELVTPGKPAATKSKPLDFAPLFLLLSHFLIAMEQLYRFAEIRRKTAEIRALSQELRVSPKLAFNACYEEIIKPKQPTLFD